MDHVDPKSGRGTGNAKRHKLGTVDANSQLDLK
jgi:hypothetical protein